MKKGLYVSEQSTGYHRLAQYLQTHSLQLLEEQPGIEHEPIQFVLLDCLEKTASPLVSQYRRRFPRASILVLATVRDEADLLQAFSLGADDYQVKPCSEREVAARIRVMLKRKELSAANAVQPPAPVLENSQLPKFEGTIGQLNLTKTEAKLLQFLLVNRKTMKTRQQIIQAVWGSQAELSSKVLDVHLFHLRKKLLEATGGRMTIRTVTNKGFYLTQNMKD